MGPDQFTGVLTDQLQECMDILDSKAKEYASDTDRLANFKVAAALQGVTARQALAGMMAKHTYSVFEMCRSDKTFTDAQWNEKITDHINYLLLLKAVTIEENAPQYELKNATVTIHDDESATTLNDVRKSIFEAHSHGWTASAALGNVLNVLGLPNYMKLEDVLEEVEQRSGSYAYRTSEECAQAKTHLTEVDNDGYCTFCGWQYHVDATAKSPEDTATASYNQDAEAADNRSKVKRLEAVFTSDITHAPSLINQATDILFP